MTEAAMSTSRGDPTAEPQPSRGQEPRARLAGLFGLGLQLALVLLVVRVFQIEETSGYGRLVPLVFSGFIVHALLPLRLRGPFFLLLSIVAIVWTLGFANGPALIAIGLGLIALCHLPFGFGVRVALVLIAASALAVLRAELVGPVAERWESLAPSVLPILASMFMFRLGIYLYDLRHGKQPEAWWARLSYFFMLPNVCFPVYPVVDSQTFARNYFDSEEQAIYQKGLLWMIRGITHLLLYRLVYYHVLPSTIEVQSLGTVTVWVVGTYLLYLRISGQFHLIVGTLCLFGFNLPETHHLYYLASSFNNFWRRINIYWKDFMMKLFYYPVFMRLRRWRMTTRIVVATATVFVVTWALHSYLWFWLRGEILFTAKDAVFWGTLGVCVTANSLYELKHRRAARRAGEWSLGAALALSVRTVTMFAAISVLWSLWSSPSISAWWQLFARAGSGSASEWVGLLVAIAGSIAVGVVIQWLAHRGWMFSIAGQSPPPVRAAAYTVAVSIALLLVSQPVVANWLGDRPAGIIASLRVDQLNQQDRDLVDRGYYEDLLDAPIYTAATTIQPDRPADWMANTRLIRRRPIESEPFYELVPSINLPWKGVPLGSNRWGLRDRDYEVEKPPGTFRIALLGGSYEMGGGVPVSVTWENELERTLNLNHAGESYERYEILNFAVGGYSLLEQVVVMDRKVPQWDVDLVILTSYQTEHRRLRTALEKITDLETLDPALREIYEESGADPSMDRLERSRRLEPYLDRIMAWGYESIIRECRDRGIPAIWAYIPATDEIGGFNIEKYREFEAIAASAGFVTVSLEGAYGGRSGQEFVLAPYDTHPNQIGHRLIADRFYDVILGDERIDLGLGPQGSAHGRSAHPQNPPARTVR